MEIVVMQDTTYIMVETSSTLRRIFTDGRARPKEREPSCVDTLAIGHA